MPQVFLVFDWHRERRQLHQAAVDRLQHVRPRAAGERRFERRLVKRVLHAKRSDARASECGEVRAAAKRLPEIVRQAADVRAAAALHFDLDLWRFEAEEVQAVDVHFPQRQFDLLALAGAFVRGASADLDRAVGRGTLLDLAGEGRQRLAEGVFAEVDVVRRHDLALGVVGVRLDAEVNGAAVDLRQVHQVLGNAHGRAD